MSNDNVKQRLLQKSKECNSKINNDPIWPVSGSFEILSTFEEDQIKTEWVMLMAKSNRCFFRNQGAVTLRIMIRSGRFSNLFEILSMCNLSASFRKNPAKRTELRWCQSQTEAFFQQSRGRSSKVNDLASFRSLTKVWLKLNELHWWQSQTEAFSAIKLTQL